jgi:hypothetical protein
MIDYATTENATVLADELIPGDFIDWCGDWKLVTGIRYIEIDNPHREDEVEVTWERTGSEFCPCKIYRASWPVKIRRSIR